MGYLVLTGGWDYGGFYYCYPPIELVGGYGVWRLTVVRVVMIVVNGIKYIEDNDFLMVMFRREVSMLDCKRPTQPHSHYPYTTTNDFHSPLDLPNPVRHLSNKKFTASGAPEPGPPQPVCTWPQVSSWDYMNIKHLLISVCSLTTRARGKRKGHSQM